MEIGKAKYNTPVDPTIIPFGKHKDEKISDVPVKYLEWLQQQDWMDDKFPELLQEIEFELLGLEAENDELEQYYSEDFYD
jgi:uncharacterized protein (DUF3820 family)